MGRVNGSGIVYEPYVHAGPNITSALGLGHRKVVKPDIFMPGGRELFSIVSTGGQLSIRHVPPGRLYGLKTAIPDAGGQLDQEGLTAGTSAATALATRAAHRLFGALSRNIQRKHRRESKQFAAFGQVRAPRFVVSRPL